MLNESVSTQVESNVQTVQPSQQSTLPFSGRCYVFEIHGNNVSFAVDKGYFPILPKHQRNVGSLLPGDLILAYIRSDEPDTDILRKEFQGAAIVLEHGFSLVDVPSYNSKGYALKVKFFEGKRVTLASANYVTKFMSNKNTKAQVSYGFFEIFGSDAEAMLQRMDLKDKMQFYVSA